MDFASWIVKYLRPVNSVGTDNVLEPENDLEDNIVNWNANKRIVFKPVIPERRIKKQRLFNLSFLLNRFRK
jgi:hypothetical protein